MGSDEDDVANDSEDDSVDEQEDKDEEGDSEESPIPPSPELPPPQAHQAFIPVRILCSFCISYLLHS